MLKLELHLYDMKQKLINFLKFLGFLSIGSVILYFVFKSQNEAYIADCALKGIPEAECSLTDKLITDFKSASPFWILMIIVSFMLSNLSRALRWRMLVRPLGYTPKLSNAFWTVMLGYFTNLGIPRSGEFVRAGTFAKYENIRADKVMGTIVVDRVMDVICLLLAMVLMVALAYDTIWAYLQENIQADILIKLVWFGLGAGLISLIAFFALRKRLEKLAFYQKVIHILYGFWDGLKTVFQLKNPWLFIFHSIAIWALYYIMTLFALKAFAPTADLPSVVGLVVFVFGALGIVIPSPGGMGTYHALVIAALSLYGVDGNDGFSLANIAFFSINIFCNIAFGILALILLPILNRDYAPERISV
jgi:uncharacterized protein (TIRG00374 family)